MIIDPGQILAIGIKAPDLIRHQENDIGRHLRRGRRIETSHLGGRDIGIIHQQIETGPAMQARIEATGVIVAVTGPIPVEIGDFNRIEARREEISGAIDGLTAMAAIVINDVDAGDFDTGTIVGSRANVHRARRRDIDVALHAKSAVVQVAGDAGIGRTIPLEKIRYLGEIVATEVEVLASKGAARRPKGVDLVVDSIGAIACAVSGDGIERALPILAL